jgi:hypothetical protein
VGFPPSPRLRWDRGFGGLDFAPVRGDDGHDRSFITRDFNRGGGKENGTIPFYRRFFDRINKIIEIQNLRACKHSVYTKFTASLHESDTDHTLSLH